MESARTRSLRGKRWCPPFLALFSFALVVGVCLERRPFTRACAGDLDPAAESDAAQGALGPIEAVVLLAPGPGEPGKLVRHPLGPFEIGAFSYGHDPPRWYADVILKDACYGEQRLGLGLMPGGTIELRRAYNGDVFQIVGRQSDGTHAFFKTIKSPKPSRTYAVKGAGLALLGSVLLALVAIGLARRVRLIAAFLTWPEGIVHDDGTLEPIEGGTPIPLRCACREKPGKRILYVPRKAGESGPYREHARRGLADHVEFSRAEGTRHAYRTNVLALGAGLLASAVAVLAFFFAGT